MDDESSGKPPEPEYRLIHPTISPPPPITHLQPLPLLLPSHFYRNARSTVCGDRGSCKAAGRADRQTAVSGNQRRN